MLGDDIAAALPDMQAQAESMMRTRCRVVRPGDTIPDPVTGADVTTTTTVFEGVSPGCKIQDQALQVMAEQVPGATVAVSRLQVHLPVTAGPFRIGDVVETFADDDTAFATPLRRFRVSNIHQKTWQTAQRLPVEELS